MLMPNDDASIFTPPTDSQSERALLAACIVDQTSIDHVAEIVDAHHFHDAAMGELFGALRTLHEAGKPLSDGNVLMPELRRMNLPVDATFIARLIVEGNTHAPNCVYYAKNVRETALLRKQQDASIEWLHRIAKGKASAEDNVAWIDSKLANVGGDNVEEAESVGTIGKRLVAEWSKPAKDQRRAVYSGIALYDQEHGGFMPGELVIVAARPGIGKSSLGMQAAYHNAAMKERPVLFVTLEMTADELMARVFCGNAGINSRRLRSQKIDENELHQLKAEVDGDIDVPLRIYAPKSATLSRIRAVAKRMQVTDGLELLVVDYLSLVAPADPRRPKQEQIAAVSMGLKALAKELNIPVIALQQLNREAEKGAPQLSHLRESGSIEQDADTVILIHHDDDQGAARLIVAKHRHSQRGYIRLRWVKEQTRFESPEDSF